MIEKVGHVSNPLTVIAIFAAISEISLVGGMTVVTPELQRIYIWFVMALPTILVLAFFGVLVWNRRVLYAPSDFRDDTAFIDLIQGQGREIASRVDQTIEQLEATTKEFKEQIAELQGVSDEQRKGLEATVASALDRITVELKGAATDAEDLIESASSTREKFTTSLNSWSTGVYEGGQQDGHLFSEFEPLQRYIIKHAARTPTPKDIDMMFLAGIIRKTARGFWLDLDGAIKVLSSPNKLA